MEFLNQQIDIEKLHKNVMYIAEQSRKNLYVQLDNIM